MDISETIKFKDICSMLDRIKKVNIPTKEKYLRRYYESFLTHRENFRREQNIEATAEENGSSSFFSVLRCLIPSADSSRGAYNIQQTSLAKIYIKVLQLSPDSREAQDLYARRFSGVHSDYADIVRRVLLPRVQCQPSDLSLKEIHDMLDTIAADDRRNMEKVLTGLVEKSSAQEQMWFIRLLLKSMHLGIGETRVLAILHPQAKDLYQRCSNLLRVCCLLADNKLTLSTASESGPSTSTSSASILNLSGAIVPFQQVRPMLCEIFPGDISPLMADDLLYMETKMDGERFQLHVLNGTFKYISRNGKDYTNSFGETSTSGNLTPLLHDLMPVGLTSIIIDGEMMVYNKVLKKFHDKGENTDVKHLRDDGSWRPCFVAYDLLYLDGTSLLDMPYVQRTYKLKCLLTEKEGVLHVMKPQRVDSMEEFKRLFQKALDENQEGVVIKKQNSVYRPGVRNGGGWFKIKADYIEGLTQEFDLIIMGGFFNRQRTWIESFLVGVMDSDERGKTEVFSVGKVANITRQRSVFNDMLKQYWHDIQVEPAPMWFHYVNHPEGRPDVWIEPKNSIILQLRATDLTNSIFFALPKCLHFPRVVRYRQDKDWQECMTLKEYRELYQGSGRNLKKINKRELSDADFTTSRKRQKLTVADKRKLGMLAYEKKINVDEIERSSDLFAGYQICVLSGSLKVGIIPEELKAMVISHGGEIVENPINSNPKCISVAGDLTYRVERMCKVGRTDIVHINWLVKCCDTGEIQPLKPNDMVCITDNLKEVFALRYDKYGDSYEDFVSLGELKQIIDNITEEQATNFKCTDEELKQLEKELNTANFFSSKKPNAYFHGSSQRVELARFLYEWHGGKYVNDTEHETDLKHVRFIFFDPVETEKNELHAWMNASFGAFLKNLQAVSIDFVIDSNKQKKMLDLAEYNCLFS